MGILTNFLKSIVLILLIFRISGILGLAGLLFYYYLNLGSFIPLGEKVEDAKFEESNATLQLEVDKNQSSQLISSLYRERSSLREKSEETSEQIKKLKEDLEVMEPKITEADQEKEKVGIELAKLAKSVEISYKPLKDLEKKNAPLFERHKQLEANQREAQEILDKLIMKTENLNGDLDALSEERRISESNYNLKRDEVLLSIRHPGYLYYGDKIEVEVSGKAPSGKGVFIDKGEKQGVKEGMLFIATDQVEQKKIPTIYQATLVQDEFSFIELEIIGESSNEIHISNGEKLFLIRTGDSNTTGL